jgi:hypothetical protein
MAQLIWPAKDHTGTGFSLISVQLRTNLMYLIRCGGIPAIALTLWLTCTALSAVVAQPVTDATQRQDISTVAGIAWKFQPEGQPAQKIIVPGGGWRAQGLTCDAGTYSAVVPIPFAAKGRVVRIAFDAINFGAAVQAGPDAAHLVAIASHVNGWVPFTADVSKIAVPGQPLFVQVEVKGRRKFMVNGKYTVPEGATWFPGLADGILRGVHLELLPTVHLDDVFVRTDVTHRLLQTTVTLTNASTAAATLTLIPRLSSASGDAFAYPKLPTQQLTLSAGETRTVELAKSAWTLGPKSYWWPNVPYLPGYRTRMHKLEVVLVQNNQAVHRMTQQFGFRQFEAHGSHYFLNGIRCNLRGDNQQEADFGTDAYGIRPGFGPPTPANAGWPKAVYNLQRLNFNVMRIHQIPATTYMLDVCDTQGLMLVDESPLRGSEGGEDFTNGHDNMLNMDRELVHRDRNHPAVIIWSAANEWSAPIREAVPAIQEIDDTRPVIADGTGDLGAPYINMEHYVSGISDLPQIGGHKRDDRPYGETEDIWANDNTRQGFAWMATSIRARRLKGDADLRNYTLNNAWSNYVPGESPDNEFLEKKIKGWGDGTILPALADPWHDANIKLMQQCYHPVAVCDTEFDQANLRSDNDGHWPVAKPRLLVGSSVVRHLAVFNDEFSGTEVTLIWEAHDGAKTGPLLGSGRLNLTIPLGEFQLKDVVFPAPKTPGELTMVLATAKSGRTTFRDDLLTFQVVTDMSVMVPNGDYLLINENSGLAVGGPGADGGLLQTATAEAPLWHLTNLGEGDISLTRKDGGKRLGIRGASNDDNAAAIEEIPGGDAVDVWHLSDQANGAFTVVNKRSGKLLDVYSRATLPGARVVQWEANGGTNQLWRFQESHR